MQKRWKGFNEKYTSDQLHDEMAKLKKLRCYQEIEKAQTSDQFKTPQSMKRKIARQYGFREFELWDPCDFNQGWRGDFFFDALMEDWPLNKKIATNWPYSKNQLFMIKACIEAQRGCNILSLINCRSTESATANKIAALIFRRQIVGAMRFEGWETINGDSYSILEFVQP